MYVRAVCGYRLGAEREVYLPYFRWNMGEVVCGVWGVDVEGWEFGLGDEERGLVRGVEKEECEDGEKAEEETCDAGPCRLCVPAWEVEGFEVGAGLLNEGPF